MGMREHALCNGSEQKKAGEVKEAGMGGGGEIAQCC